LVDLPKPPDVLSIHESRTLETNQKGDSSALKKRGNLMIWLPGWNTVSGANWWEDFWFWVSIGALIGLGCAEVISHRYGIRRDELAAEERHKTDKSHDAAIAQLHERAAKAEQKAAEANLAVAKLRTGRIIAVDQIALLTTMASNFPGMKYDFSITGGADEPSKIRIQIDDALQAAKWIPEDWHGSITYSSPGRKNAGDVGTVGLSIAWLPGAPAEVQHAVQVIVDALNPTGFVTGFGVVGENTKSLIGDQDMNAVHILIGEKPM
jgi:hypothetical protein